MTNSNSKPAYIEFIFNEGNDTVKNFKTLNFEGEGNWSATIATDQESTLDSSTVVENWSTAGNIANDDWVNKEGKLHAWIRGVNGAIDTQHITVGGIGQVVVDGQANTLTKTNPISSKLNVGDDLYYYDNIGTAEAPNYLDTPIFMGNVMSISSDRRVITYSTTNRADGSAITGTVLEPTTNDFVVYSKDRVTEASGIIGFFAIVRMTNTDNATKAELFAVETEVFRSSN